MSIKEQFVQNYGEQRVDSIGYCDEANVIAIFPKSAKTIGTIDVDGYEPVNNVTECVFWNSGKDTKQSINVYKVENEDSTVYLTKNIIDPFLDLLDCTTNDLLSHPTMDRYPVIIDTGEDMLGIVAPRIESDSVTILERAIVSLEEY